MSLTLDHYIQKYISWLKFNHEEGECASINCPYCEYAIYRETHKFVEKKYSEEDILHQVFPAQPIDYKDLPPGIHDVFDDKLLEAAKEFDEKTDQPDCELDEKREALKTIAKAMGVKIRFLFDD